MTRGCPELEESASEKGDGRKKEWQKTCNEGQKQIDVNTSFGHQLNSLSSAYGLLVIKTP